MTRNSSDGTNSEGTERRRFLELAGTGVALTVGLSGCLGTEGGGGDGGGGGTPTPTGGGTTTGTATESGPDSVLVGQPASITGKWDFLQPAVSQATDLAKREVNRLGVKPRGFPFPRRDLQTPLESHQCP